MRLTSALLIVVLASPALSQRGVGANRARMPAAPRQREGVPIGGGDIERLSPARVVLDRRQELKIEKPQAARLDTLRRAFDDSAKRLASNIKSYQKAITSIPPAIKRPPEGKPETRKDSLERAKLDSTNRLKRDKYFETVTAGRRDLAAALLALKDLFDASLASTIKALDGSQHTAVALSLERASDEFTQRLRMANVR